MNTMMKMPWRTKELLCACFAILSMLLTGCGQAQQKPTRPPISAQEVKTIAAEIKRVSSAYIDAWNQHSTDLMSQLFTDDIKYYEPGNSPLSSSKTGLIFINGMVLGGSPDFEGRQLDTFIGLKDGFDIWEMWNYEGSTKEKPFLAYDWYSLSDGKISSMWLFWGSDAIARWGGPNHNSTFSQKPLEDYALAWSSGDPKAVANLYDAQAVRLDTLFKEEQQGSPAIEAYATNFYTWYPRGRFELLQSFKLGDSVPVKAGGVFALHVTNQAGKPCDVRAIILLESSEEKITHEWIFYQADSLLACGWAR